MVTVMGRGLCSLFLLRGANIFLSLYNAEIGTSWTTGPVNFDPGFIKIVSLENLDELIECFLAIIWFGNPTKKSDPPKKKLALDDVLICHPSLRY